MMKRNCILWLGLLAVLLCTTGCPVDVNEGDGMGDDGGGTTPECPSAELATVRFFHAAGGTPVTRPDFGPATTRNLNVIRPDVLDPVVGSDPPKMEPRVVTSLAPGRAALVQLCANKDLTLNARLVGGKETRIAQSLVLRLTPDADPKLFDAGRTIILAGIADALKSDGTPENPKSVTDPLRFIEVMDTFDGSVETQAQVVHASRKVGTPVQVEINPDAAMSEIAVLDRYMASGIVGTKGSTDAAPATVAVVFQDAASTKTSFTISPRIPVGAKALAILFDTEVFDPKNPDPTKVSPAPTPRLFVTGDDPLLGRVAGGGVQF
ncbi:MAG TPA: hypothetical protein VNO30_50605 [Kofleriaceae bacterium]|nr:hypothetical protein [Kofleriaceae bacterium]